MQDQYFVVDLAHSAHGRLRQIRIAHKTIVYSLVAVLLLGLVSVCLMFSYARMWAKVAHFNSLRAENKVLKERYEGLQKENKQASRQLASFQMLATEITQAYGLGQRSSVLTSSVSEPLLPSLGESLQEFRVLREAELFSLNRRGVSAMTLPLEVPNFWPVTGRLTSPFGVRSDPFSGEGAFHTGVDISTYYRAPARATANGVVLKAEYIGGYGNVVVVDHNNGYQTYYGHLASFAVMPGQTIRRGQTVGYCGSTGRSTGVHLHYEIRRGSVPINPYPMMARMMESATPRRDLPF